MKPESKAKSKQLKRSVDALQQLSFSGPDKKQTSFQTIVGITNSMVGSICLVIPIVFKQSGVLTATLVMIFLGAVQYKTCQLLVFHLSATDKDTEHMIKRLIGKFWANAFRLSSGTLLFIVGIIYYQLINLTLFPIIEFIMIKSNYDNYAHPDSSITFNKFSIQWLAIIIFLPLSCMLLLKDITQIIKLAHYGVFAIIAYGIFVVYIFFDTLFSDHFDVNKVEFFTTDFNKPAGQFALAFMIHNAVGQLTKNNIKPENNSRDLAIAYALAALIYGTIGCFGAIALQGREVDNPQTILNYFHPEDVSVLLIESFFLIHLVTAFPIFNYISKHQILEVLYPKGYPTWIYWGFSALFMSSCLIVQVLNINVGLVIAFDGAVCGFIQIYIIPVMLHFKCYYGKKKQTLIQAEDSLEISVDAACDHPKTELSFYIRVTIYTLIILVGVYNLVMAFYDLFK